MALKNYSPDISKYVTVGGSTREGVKNPTEIEGYYLGRTESPDNFNPGKTKTTYMLRTAKGDVGVNGSANLNIKMTDSEKALQAAGESALNSFVKITFVGTQPSKKGNPTKLYQVQFDAEDTLPANMVAEEPEADLDEVFGDDLEEIEEAPAVAAPAASRERAAALLNRKSARKS